MKKRLLVLTMVLIFIIIGLLIFKYTNKEDVRSDNVIFSSEYPNVEIDNIYDYRTIDEIINIINNQTGIILLSHPDNDLTNEYVSNLNSISKNIGLSKIYYYSINDNQDNKLITLLKNKLNVESIDNPTLLFVVKGKIIGFDSIKEYDTSLDLYQQMNDKLSSLITTIYQYNCLECEA